MPTKSHAVVLRRYVSATLPEHKSLYRNESTQSAEIARALAPLRPTISNPPTAADVKAVSDKLDALLAESRH